MLKHYTFIDNLNNLYGYFLPLCFQPSFLVSAFDTHINILYNMGIQGHTYSRLDIEECVTKSCNWDLMRLVRGLKRALSLFHGP